MTVTSAQLQASDEALNRARSKLITALDSLDSLVIDGAQGFDASRPFHDLDFNYEFVLSRIAVLRMLIASLPSQIPDEVVPTNIRTGIFTRSNEVDKLATQLTTFMETVRSKGGTRPINWAAFNIVSNDKSHALDVPGSIVKPIIANIDRIQQELFVVRQAVTANDAEKLEASTSVISAFTETQNAASNSKENALHAKASAEIALRHAGESEGAKNRVDELEKEIRKTRDALVAIEGDTKAKKAEADSVINSAAALKEQVDQYSAQFTAFSKAMDGRLDALSKGDKELEKLTSDLNAQSENITSNIARATEMLKSATNAALTHAQQQKYDELGDDLRGAGVTVYVAYSALFLSVIPILAYLIYNWNTTIAFTGGWDYVGNVFVRGIVLLPALLFVAFATRRYSRLFRLRHEYGYRAALAGAVEGFKSQAPAHGDDIAAVAFYQLGKNPAESIDNERDAAVWYEKVAAIMERFADRFGGSSPTPKA